MSPGPLGSRPPSVHAPGMFGLTVEPVEQQSVADHLHARSWPPPPRPNSEPSPDRALPPRRRAAELIVREREVGWPQAEFVGHAPAGALEIQADGGGRDPRDLRDPPVSSSRSGGLSMSLLCLHVVEAKIPRGRRTAEASPLSNLLIRHMFDPVMGSFMCRKPPVPRPSAARPVMRPVLAPRPTLPPFPGQ